MSRLEDVTFLKSENENALDNFYGAVGSVAVGYCHVIHVGRLHSYSARARDRVVTDWHHPRPKSDLTSSLGSSFLECFPATKVASCH